MEQARILLAKLYCKSRQAVHEVETGKILKQYNIHPTVRWGFDARIYGPGLIFIGEHTYLGGHCFVLSNVPDVQLVIGKHCAISHSVHIRTETHRRMFQYQEEKQEAPSGADVVIGDYVWIGAHVFIKGGVRIGDNCIVGADSVVTHDIPPDSVYGGVPARLIRMKSDYLNQEKKG